MSYTVTDNDIAVGADGAKSLAEWIDDPTLPPDALFPGSVARSVAAKLGETVSAKDFGAVGDGSDCTDAIDAAWIKAQTVRSEASGGARAIVTYPIFLPPGDYVYSGAGLTPSANCIPMIIGVPGATRLTIDADIYLVDVTQNLLGAYFSGLQVIGGKGLFRCSYGTSVAGNTDWHRVFKDLVLVDYTETAICSENDNDPGYRYQNIKLYGADGSKGIVIPPGSNQVVDQVWWNKGTIGLHIRTGEGTTVRGFRAGKVTAGQTVYPVWIEPVSGADNGRGLVFDACVWGNETVEAGDASIFIGTYVTTGTPRPCNSVPKTDAESTLELRGLTIEPTCTFMNNTSRSRGIIYSMTQRIGNLTFDRPMIYSKAPYVVEFYSGITAFSNSLLYAASNVIRLRGTFQSTTLNHKTEFRISNLPGFAVVEDPMGASLRTGEIVNPPLGLPGADFIDLTTAMSGLAGISSTASIGSAEADAVGGTLAYTVTFNQADGRANLILSTTNAVAGRQSWLELDYKAASSQALVYLTVRLGEGYSTSIAQRRVEVVAGWRTLVIPFTLPQASTAMRCILVAAGSDYSSGVTDKVVVGRIRLYQSSHRCITRPQLIFSVTAQDIADKLKTVGLVTQAAS